MCRKGDDDGPWAMGDHHLFTERDGRWRWAVGGGGQGYFGQFFNFVFPHVSVVCARIIRRCSVGLLAGFFDCFLPLLPCLLCLLESCLRCSPVT